MDIQPHDNPVSAEAAKARLHAWGEEAQEQASETMARVTKYALIAAGIGIVGKMVGGRSSKRSRRPTSRMGLVISGLTWAVPLIIKVVQKSRDSANDSPSHSDDHGALRHPSVRPKNHVGRVYPADVRQAP